MKQSENFVYLFLIIVNLSLSRDAPENLSTSLFSLINTNVGKDITLYLDDKSCDISVSTFKNKMLGNSTDNSSKWGACHIINRNKRCFNFNELTMNLQGPHQLALKSTTQKKMFRITNKIYMHFYLPTTKLSPAFLR